MNFFLNYHLNNGTPPHNHAHVKRVLYRYFPANWRLSRKVSICRAVLYSGKYDKSFSWTQILFGTLFITLHSLFRIIISLIICCC